MRPQDYKIDIGANTVDVMWDDSGRSIKARAGSIGLVAFAAFVFYLLMLRPDRYGFYSWTYLREGPRDLASFLPALMAVVIGSGLSSLFLLLGIRKLFPSGERLRCDKSTFTVSKIPWINLRGKWVTHSFALPEISRLQFVKVAGRKYKSDDYGIRYFAGGKKRNLFVGIEVPEASVILKGLEKLGADVLPDPDLPIRVKMALEDREEQL